MPHNYRSHPSKFRQRDFWLPHEAPGSRHGVTITICSLLFILIVFMYLLISKNDTTEYATRDQVDKIETHLFQLEERLVWTDEKIDTMQAVAEAAAMRVIDEKTVTDSMSKPEMAKESEPEQQVPDESKVTKPPQEKPEVEIAAAKTSPDISSQPKEIPVIQPKIKKKKIKRRDYGIIYKYHKVRNGETLYRIGLKYNVPVSEIRRLNHLKPNESIHPGQRLLVSQGER